VEAVDELEAERDEQRDAQQHKGQQGGGADARFAHIRIDAVGDEEERRRQDAEEDDSRACVQPGVQIRPHDGGSGNGNRTIAGDRGFHTGGLLASEAACAVLVDWRVREV
jgi:hypothetical protein